MLTIDSPLPHTQTHAHTHLSSVTDVIQSSLGVVTVDHMLCDCFFFTEGFTSCCHANAACGFGTYGSNKKPILPSEIVSFRSVTPQRGSICLHLEHCSLKYHRNESWRDGPRLRGYGVIFNKWWSSYSQESMM